MTSSANSKLVIGCGYLGHRVARRWLSGGADVTVTTRSPARAEQLAAEGLTSIVADVTQPESLRHLPAASTVLFAVGFDRTQQHSIEEVYRDGLANVLEALPTDVERLIYISSTGVYGSAEGEWIDEATPPCPSRAGGRACLAAEQALQHHRLADRGIILRLAGIYGPQRIPRAEDLRQGKPLAAEPTGWLNLIHVDDAAAVVLAVEAQVAPPALINICDGVPVVRAEYYAELARLLGTAPPEFVPPPADASERARGAASKRLSNQRMQELLNLPLQYPSYREGLAAVVARQEQLRHGD